MINVREVRNMPANLPAPTLTKEQQEELRARLGGAATGIAEPSPVELAANFGKAMATWTAAGFPTVDEATYAARAAACDACPLWDGKARFGLGKCRAPGCGCTKFKRWLVTERCKHPAGSRWPA